MNMITDTYKSFQMLEAEGNRIFFHVKDVQNWDFYNYFMSTYSNMNKFKSFNLIKTDYSNNLLWITQSDVPSEVREYVLKLKKDALKYLLLNQPLIY
jgi:predicted Zn-dependent protease